MTKSEFMSELKVLLIDLPSEEREAALTYYDDYFEDAGPDKIDYVISDLGTPEKVAAMIKTDLNNSAAKDSDKIIYTESGYKDTNFEEDRFEVVSNEEQSYQENDSSFKQKNTTYSKAQNENNGTSKIILIILICILAIPVGIPVISTVFGLFIAAVATLFGLFVALLAITGAFLVSGIILFVAGVIQLFITPTNGIFMCGVGLILSGLGTLGGMLTFVICTKVIPVVVRGFVNLCKMPFNKRGETR